MAFSDTYSPKRGPYFMEAEPGEYRGAVTVAAGEVTQSLPLVLQVYPLAPTIGQLRKAVQQEYARSDAALVSGLKYVHPQSIDPVDEARAHAVRQHTFRVRTGLIRLFVFARPWALRRQFLASVAAVSCWNAWLVVLLSQTLRHAGPDRKTRSKLDYCHGASLSIPFPRRPTNGPLAARRAYASPEAYEGRCGVAGRQRLEFYSDRIQETNELDSR
jgi:hypothetical protein